LNESSPKNAFQKTPKFEQIPHIFFILLLFSFPSEFAFSIQISTIHILHTLKQNFIVSNLTIRLKAILSIVANTVSLNFFKNYELRTIKGAFSIKCAGSCKKLENFRIFSNVSLLFL